MTEAMIGLISAVSVVGVEKIADFVSQRFAHKDKQADMKQSEANQVIEEITKLQTSLKVIEGKIDDNNAKESRIRILRFEDEMLHEIEHSEEHFKQIIEDINEYEAYCEAHPDFHNGIAEHAMQHIEEIYKQCLNEHKFI